MQKNKWNRKFDWVKSGSTYYQKSRTEQYNENRFISVGDIYFKMNKYLTGVTFKYINSLYDIYKRDLLTGDGYAIVNMYNEYDIIDWFLKNIIFVDIASNINIDLNTQYTKIDGVKLKPGHLVLLYNQNSEFENDIYVVTPQYFLMNAGYLSTREKSDKFSCSVRLGTNADKQFFLINNGFDFPVTFEPKYFIEGKSFILKNLIRYNLYNTSTNSAMTSKIIFTDYEFARKQLSVNYSLYNNATITVDNSVTPSESYVTVYYHRDSYTIRTGTTITYSGYTSGITNNSFSGYTSIPYPVGFECAAGDYIYLNIYNGPTTLLVLETFIKEVNGGYIILEDIIPNRVLNDLKSYVYNIENLSIATSWNDSISKLSGYTPYIDFYSVSATTSGTGTTITIRPKESKYDLYFDYDGIYFDFIDYVEIISDSNRIKFTTTNQYIKYKLYDRLNEINPSIFTTTFSGISNSYILTGFTYEYTDNDRIRIISSNSALTSIFKPYTYVYVSGSTESMQRTLLYSVNNYELIIEKPALWTDYPPPDVTLIQNIDGLSNISNLLYEVYMNNENSWYIRRTDNERKYICKSYAQLLTSNETIRRYVTGILYETDNNEFLLKLYDIENDRNLSFSSVELVFVGTEKKTRLPVPLTMIEDSRTGDDYTLDWNVLDGGFDDPLYDKEVFDFGLDSVLPGPNNPPLIYTTIDGNL